jgi:tRNA threonylcarbamoyladenosine biosynthesis protein TsaE
VGYDIARSLVKSGTGEKSATVFALQGDLGAGKTTFVQGFLRGLGSRKRATSPTFVLMRRHTLRAGRGGGMNLKNVFHIDAYRLKKPEYLAALELDIILNGPHNVVLIEWPEQAKRFLPKNAVWLKFRHGRKENERTITITRLVCAKMSRQK